MVPFAFLFPPLFKLLSRKNNIAIILAHYRRQVAVAFISGRAKGHRNEATRMLTNVFSIARSIS